MVNSIIVRKVFCKDENIKFPICKHCGNECSPHEISTNELVKLESDTIVKFINLKYLLLDHFGKDKNLIFICKHCCKGERL